LWESPKEKDNLKDHGVNGEDGMKMGRREIGWLGVCVCVCVCVEWIHLAQDRDRCQAVVNAVMNLRVLEPRS
jgi:hypothetical protein